jgi:hypothetical protein
MPVSPHHVLGIAPDAEPEVVEAAYRALMKKYHPDRWRGSPNEATQRAQDINAAYAALRTGHAALSPPGAPDRFFVDPIPTALLQPRPPFRTGRQLLLASGVSAAAIATIYLLIS